MVPIRRRGLGLCVCVLAMCGLLASAGAHAQSLPPCDFAARAVPLAFGAVRQELHGGRECTGIGDSWYSARANEGALYRLKLPATTAFEVTAHSADFPPVIRLFDAQGVRVVHMETRWTVGRERPPLTAALPVTLPAGTYYIAVTQGASYPGSQVGRRYELRLRKLDIALTPDAGGPCEQRREPARRRLPLDGQTVDSVLGPADCFRFGTYHQHFRLSVPTRRTIAVQAVSGAFPVSVKLQDASGSFLQKEEDADASDAGLQAEVPAGEYIVHVSHKDLRFAGGAFRLTARTVGAPSADASRVGAVCADAPDPIPASMEPVRLRGLLTEASCRGADGESYYHSYAFTADRPYRLTVWRASGRALDYEIVGPSGPLNLDRPERYDGKTFDAMVPPGQYRMRVSIRPHESYTSATGRFELPVSARPVLAGEAATHRCDEPDVRAVRLGEAVQGALRPESCILTLGEAQAPAELFRFTLGRTQRVRLEVEPEGIEPMVLVTTPDGGAAAQPTEGPGPRRLDIDLPAGDHTVIVIPGDNGEPGPFRLRVSAP